MTRHLPMVSLLMTLPSLAVALPAMAAPAKGTAAASKGSPALPDSAIYLVDYRSKLVTVTDGGGKNLFKHHATTPTIQAVLTPNLPMGTTPETRHSAVPLRALTVEDANGSRLWSTAVSVAGLNSMSMDTGSSYKGTRLTFKHKQRDTPAPTTADAKDDEPTPKNMVIAIGDGGLPVSATIDGKTIMVFNGQNGGSMNTPEGKYAFTMTSQGGNVTGPNGLAAKIGLAKDGKGGTFLINGKETAFTYVKRDGKEYMTFPWNDHPVFVETGCSIDVNSNGELIINAPAKGK